MEEWNTAAKRMDGACDDAGLEVMRTKMREAFAKKGALEIEAFLLGQPDIIWERVRQHNEVLRDPQTLANGYIVDLELPAIGRIPVVGPLVELSRTPPPASRPPPELGHDTVSLMTELGFDAQTIEAACAHAGEMRTRSSAGAVGSQQ